MLNVDRLRALHAIAEHGTVLGAADSLHVTTSAVSQQVAKLEAEVGRRLLERQGRGVRLTDAGRQLVVHAAQVLAVLERAAADLDASRDRIAGPLAVAGFATGIRGLAPRALVDLRTRHPQLQPSLRELDPEASMPLLVRRELDLVIAQDWHNAPIAIPDTLEKVWIVDDIADIALPRGHRLARGTTIALDDLANEPWITWVAGACHDWLLLTLRRRGHEPRVAHTASEYATQLALVAAGLGAAVIPRLGRGAVPRGVKVLASEPTLRRHVYALWRKDASRQAAIHAAVDAFQRAGAATVSR